MHFTVYCGRKSYTMTQKLNEYIDHTLLKPYATEKQIRQLCEEATTNQFAAVCVPPYFIKVCKTVLKDSNVQVASVTGFPNGYDHIGTKMDSIKRSIDLGADEIDAVINIAAVKSGRWQDVESELDSLVTACRLKGRKIKLIIEAALLTQEELEKLMPIIIENCPHFVKTSTGYHVPENQVELIKWLRAELPDTVKLKASGGIRSAEMAQAVIAAGAERIGTSSALKLIAG
jgi:deoxyribose-phosphate aldolase